jgi:hypothetical protein
MTLAASVATFDATRPDDRSDVMGTVAAADSTRAGSGSI